jgi:sugar/nucleoside kinase (ribokinase family)
MAKRIRISGVGCCLVDKLYTSIDFNSTGMQPYLSKQAGDGGLVPGQLVFVEEFEDFCKKDFSQVLHSIIKGKTPDSINVGGPSIVSLINASQILSKDEFEICFYGKTGDDEAGKYLSTQIGKTAVNINNLLIAENPTPNTIVLSDPDYDNGHGERMFINSIAAAWELSPEDLDEKFFSSAYVAFGATALSPVIHDHLSFLLRKVKSNGGITIVNTVFDFRNEKKNTFQKWPLGADDESYKYTDLLIMDRVEACRLSGKEMKEEAFRFFIEKGVSSFIITNGSEDVIAYSDGRLFKYQEKLNLPVSLAIAEQNRGDNRGDTTGCGDNFAGGVIASLCQQTVVGSGQPCLTEACIWGIISGGFSCLYNGGTYQEKYSGDKHHSLKKLYVQYEEQIRDL